MGALSSTTRTSFSQDIVQTKSSTYSRACTILAKDGVTSQVNKRSLFFSLPVEIQKWILTFMEFHDLLLLRIICFSFLRFIDFNYVQLNIPVRFFALHQMRNVGRFERSGARSIWNQSKTYVTSRQSTVGRYGLRFHSFGLLSAKWMKESLPSDLHHLWIQTCRLDRDSISSVPRHLKQLVIKDCKTLKDSHLSQLPPGLEMLVLFKCPYVSDQGIKNFSPSTRQSLRHLDLTCNQNITNEVFRYLPNTLEFLELSSCKQLSDQGIIDYGLPSALRSFSVNCIDAMTNKIMVKIPSGLIYLDLVHTNAKLTEEFRDAVPPSLQEIRLCSCNAISRVSLGYLKQDLKRLSLMHCRNLWPDVCDLIPINLRILSLYGSASNDILAKIPHNIVDLDIAASKHVTDDGIKHLTARTNLRTLRMDELNITSNSISLLPPNLNEISISKCALLNDLALVLLPQSISKVTAMDCPLITARGIHKLQTQRRELMVVAGYSISRDVLKIKFSSSS